MLELKVLRPTLDLNFLVDHLRGFKLFEASFVLKQSLLVVLASIVLERSMQSLAVYSVRQCVIPIPPVLISFKIFE